MAELQVALAADQVHLTEVSQDGDVGEGTVGGAEALHYVQSLDRPSLISRVIDAAAPVAVADAPCCWPSAPASGASRWRAPASRPSSS